MKESKLLVTSSSLEILCVSNYMEKYAISYFNFVVNISVTRIMSRLIYVPNRESSFAIFVEMFGAIFIMVNT